MYFQKKRIMYCIFQFQDGNVFLGNFSRLWKFLLMLSSICFLTFFRDLNLKSNLFFSLNIFSIIALSRSLISCGQLLMLFLNSLAPIKKHPVQPPKKDNKMENLLFPKRVRFMSFTASHPPKSDPNTRVLLLNYMRICLLFLCFESSSSLIPES